MPTAKREFLSKTKQKFYDEIKQYQLSLKPTKEIEGYGSAPIVGEKNYPYLSTHNISNSNKDSSFFNTSKIVKKDYDEVISLKARNILGSTEKTYVKKVNERISDEIRNIYKSKKPIEFSSEFEKELKFDRILVNKVSGVMGSRNPLLTLKANENTSTSSQIEKYISDDLKAKDAIIDLYEKGVNEHQIINLLALGSFGIDMNKKLVPTKWAITAYDQTIEKHLFTKLRNLSPIEKYEIYHHKDKENEFVILLIPDTFTGEVIEAFSTNIEKDYIDHQNRLDKKEPETAGGFYATKIAIFESLLKRKRQAAFISVRVIGDYDVPLGVVFVRESVREAMKKPIFESSDEKEIFDFLQEKYLKHSILTKNSKVLKERRKQRKLNEFG